MRKKLWSVILTAAIAVGALAGCGQTGTIAATDTTQKADTATEAATDTEADPASEAETADADTQDTDTAADTTEAKDYGTLYVSFPTGNIRIAIDILAQQLGYFKEEGVTVEEVNLGGMDALTAINSADGNLDILTVAYNMFSQGINPELNIENVTEIKEVYERCCKMDVPMRHPYAGKLVFTAFSGSHQDAINKGMKAMQERRQEWWEVPYLPIDPSDIGREYEPIVRINSQSGKGGVAFVMDSEFGYKLPKRMHKEFADVIQKIAESQGEVAPATMMEVFEKEYLRRKAPYEFIRAKAEDVAENETEIEVVFMAGQELKSAKAVGNGPLAALKKLMTEESGMDFTLIDYSQHALSQGSEAKAAAYICLRDNRSGKETYGVGVSANITRAGFRAFFSAVDRLMEEK